MNNTNHQRIKLDNTALFVIDIQEKLFPFINNKDSVLKNSTILINGAKELGLKTIINEQYPKGLGPTIEELQPLIQGLEKWEKTSFSVYIDNQEKVDQLLKSGIDTFILCGIETHVCVYQTAKCLLEKGAKVYLAYDALGSREYRNHKMILSTLQHLGAVVVPTETILFELMIHSKHQAFKAISKLVK